MSIGIPGLGAASLTLLNSRQWIGLNSRFQRTVHGRHAPARAAQADQAHPHGVQRQVVQPAPLQARSGGQ